MPAPPPAPPLSAPGTNAPASLVPPPPPQGSGLLPPPAPGTGGGGAQAADAAPVPQVFTVPPGLGQASVQAPPAYDPTVLGTLTGSQAVGNALRPGRGGLASADAGTGQAQALVASPPPQPVPPPPRRGSRSSTSTRGRPSPGTRASTAVAQPSSPQVASASTGSGWRPTSWPLTADELMTLGSRNRPSPSATTSTRPSSTRSTSTPAASTPGSNLQDSITQGAVEGLVSTGVALGATGLVALTTKNPTLATAAGAGAGAAPSGLVRNASRGLTGLVRNGWSAASGVASHTGQWLGDAARGGIRTVRGWFGG